METAFIQFLAAPADRASVHIRHRLEQRRVQFDWMVRFGERELGYGSIELQLKTLKQDRMENAAFGALPAQDAVSENEFDPLGFTINASVKGVKRFENFHRRASRLFSFHPVIPHELPAL